MANKGFYMMDAYLSRTSRLTDEELGRLFRACMIYHATGEITELEGRESVAFDFIREDIDAQAEAYAAKCETNRRNRMSAIYDDRQQSSTVVNDRQPEQTAVHNVKVKEKVNVKVNEKAAAEYDQAPDAEAFRIQAEHTQILDAAEDAGFPRTNTVRARLLDAYAEHGKEKLLRAISECATHSAASIAYLDAVLHGKPKAQPKPIKTVTAQQYSQRDYSGSEESADEMVARLKRLGNGNERRGGESA